METKFVLVATEPNKAPPDSAMMSICRLLNEKAMTARQYQTTSTPSADMLIHLLSKLPYEIRLNIYELCIPCMWHRKRRVRLDYIVDCKWMATSPLIFDEAAPLVLTKSTPFIYTSLDEHENLVRVFAKHIERAFTTDSHWVKPAARSMVRSLAVTIRWPYFYNNKYNLEDRMVEYFKNVESFENLKTLYISFGPDFLPLDIGDPTITSNEWTGDVEFPPASKLERAAVALKQVVPSRCTIVCRFDRAGMPGMPPFFNDKRQAVFKYLEGINSTMGRFWSRQ